MLKLRTRDVEREDRHAWDRLREGIGRSGARLLVPNDDHVESGHPEQEKKPQRAAEDRARPIQMGEPTGRDRLLDLGNSELPVARHLFGSLALRHPRVRLDPRRRQNDQKPHGQQDDRDRSDPVRELEGVPQREGYLEEDQEAVR